MLINNAIKQKSPLIIELIGPAGVGKTTLARTLAQRDEKIIVAADLELRKKEHFLIFACQVPSLLSVSLRRSRPSKWFTWDEFKAMAYLMAWPRVLRRQASNYGPVILLDHGPIFKLAKLNAFGPERLKSKGFEQWWHTIFEHWANTLGIIVWLNAPDTILVKRVNCRSQRHAVKGKSEQEASKFLARYRSSYEQMLAKLTAYGGPALLEFDTSQASIEEIVDKVLVTCNLKLAGS